MLKASRLGGLEQHTGEEEGSKMRLLGMLRGRRRTVLLNMKVVDVLRVRPGPERVKGRKGLDYSSEEVRKSRERSFFQSAWVKRMK